MCGICGIFSFQQAARQPDILSSVVQMTTLMHRRGPDDEGFWNDDSLALGFRRLAIIDLSPAGHQPMHSVDGRSVIVFNGEMYNFIELRRELESHGLVFHSRSDTEVVLQALNCWGLEALDRFNGMFALAWYDKRERKLLLARDHAGIKPLHYAIFPNGQGIAFGSQYNCLLQTPWGMPGALRTDALHLCLRLNHLPPPYGILENTYQLEPGQYALFGVDGRLTRQYWWRLPRDPQPTLAERETVDALQAALGDAVQRQRIADVPLGVFLSGGVDSPLVAAVARSQTSRELKAFTIGNPGWWQDESADAQEYARSIELDHRLHNIGGLDAVRLFEDAVQAQTEPFGDYSIMPTLLVSEFARTELTVALSGDGGDELFWGYERPLSLLRGGSDFRYPRLIRMGLYGAGKYGVIKKRSRAVLANDPGDYYYGVNSRLSIPNIDALIPQGSAPPADFMLYHFDGYKNLRHLANYSRWVEFYGQLQRGLKKVDFASMHHSLEVRVPLLDRKVIEVSIGLDPFDAMKNGTRKAVLRDLLTRYVAADKIPTGKRGFAVPLGDWLRGSLRPIVEEMLLGNKLHPVFNRAAMRAYCESHFNGSVDHKWGLWGLLTFQAWAVKNSFNG
jgi:asparagine synthase (glutamine-hydrolysing)